MLGHAWRPHSELNVRISCHNICPRLLCIFLSWQYQSASSAKDHQAKESLFLRLRSCFLKWSLCLWHDPALTQPPLHFPTWITGQGRDHLSTLVLLASLGSLAFGIWLVVLLESVLAWEGQPGPKLSLLWASPEACPRAGQPFLCCHQVELLQSSGPQAAAGALCSFAHLQWPRAVVVAAAAIAADGEITRPQGECLKLLKKKKIEKEEKSGFRHRPDSQLRNTDCTLSDFPYKWRSLEEKSKSLYHRHRKCKGVSMV